MVDGFEAAGFKTVTPAKASWQCQDPITRKLLLH